MPFGDSAMVRRQAKTQTIKANRPTDQPTDRRIRLPYSLILVSKHLWLEQTWPNFPNPKRCSVALVSPDRDTFFKGNQHKKKGELPIAGGTN